MLSWKKPAFELPAARPGDVRIGDLIGTGIGEEDTPSAVVMGFPCDQGVAVNAGRVGAAKAPDPIRGALYRFTARPDAGDGLVDLIGRIRDLGNLVPAPTVEESQLLLAEALAPWLSRGVPAIVLGGGHETAYGHFLGYLRSGLAVEIVNWDAHPDVRETRDGRAHSGSSFRLALTHPSGLCRGYTVAGLLPHMIAEPHLRFLREMKGTFYWGEELSLGLVEEIFAGISTRCLATFDMDAVDQAFAPGVSAPATGGMMPALWLKAARLAGRCPYVSSMEIVEVNPTYDRDEQTVRLAGLTLWHFLEGLAERRRPGG
ncbi:MAG TPA: formimidoylglutamase [Syntrophobacteria bacterium]|nr:formimidoylglutamase [Syntrophobacteria bacterium]